MSIMYRIVHYKRKITSKHVSYESQTLFFAVGRSTTSLGSCQKCRHTSQFVSWGNQRDMGEHRVILPDDIIGFITSLNRWAVEMNTQNRGLQTS